MTRQVRPARITGGVGLGSLGGLILYRVGAALAKSPHDPTPLARYLKWNALESPSLELWATIGLVLLVAKVEDATWTLRDGSLTGTLGALGLPFWLLWYAYVFGCGPYYASLRSRGPSANPAGTSRDDPESFTPPGPTATPVPRSLARCRDWKTTRSGAPEVN